MKRLLAVLLTVPTFVMADSYIGVAQGEHLVGKGLVDTHFLVGYEKRNFGTVTFNNSFNRLSVALYYNLNAPLSKSFTMGTKLGVTSGYNSVNVYDGKEYLINEDFFINDNLLLTSLPYIEYKINSKNKVDLSLLGVSVNLGYTYSF